MRGKNCIYLYQVRCSQFLYIKLWHDSQEDMITNFIPRVTIEFYKANDNYSFNEINGWYKIWSWDFAEDYFRYLLHVIKHLISQNILKIFRHTQENNTTCLHNAEMELKITLIKHKCTKKILNSQKHIAARISEPKTYNWRRRRNLSETVENSKYNKFTRLNKRKVLLPKEKNWNNIYTL